MAQPSSKRLVTEQYANDTFLKTDELNLDERMADPLSVPSTESRRALSAAYLGRDDYAGLLRWYAAYAGRDSQQARVAIISDYEGLASAVPHHRNRWHRLLELALRGPLAPGGPGFIPAMYGSSAMTDATTRTGGTIEESQTQYGPGGRLVNVRGGGVLAFPSETITGFRVWYTKGDFFSGTGDIKVDGGATIASIDSANGGAGALDAITWPALPAPPHAVSAGAHVVSITGPGGNSSQIGAVQLFNGDENKGVHVFDLGRAGLSFVETQDTNWNLTLWQSWIKKIDPHLVIIMLGGAKFGSDPDFTEPQITSTMARVDAMENAATSSVLLVAPPRPVKNPAGSASRWADYVNRMKHEASLRSDRVSFLDMQESWPLLVAGGATNLGLMRETDYPYHPSAAGQRRFVDILTKVLV